MRRRKVLKLAVLGTAGLIAGQNPTRSESVEENWARWQEQWRWMEDIARRRGWNLTPLSISPPASDSDIRRIEIAHGLTMPAQLRTVLTRFSAHVRFGWHIPGHLRPMEQLGFPTSSSNRNAIWDLAQIEHGAIPNFLNWKQALAREDRSEAPNDPAMWENQFPFYELVNGDMLTIDMSRSDGPQPVRYFSHELAMLHGQALAPDFFTFISEMAALGHAGTEWASWMPFGSWDEDRYYIRADSEGGRAWRAWLERDPQDVEQEEPPPAIVEETPAERALLTAARDNDEAAVAAALLAGARADVVWKPDALAEMMSWNDEFCTAVSYATRNDNIALLERLVKHGATLNTRRLPLGEAAEWSSLETARWLIARGARTNGWRDQRHWPLHLLITRRARYVAEDRLVLQARLRKEEQQWDLPGLDNASGIVAQMKAEAEKRIAADLERQINRADYLAMLDAFLEAGANPDARWDNGITMLMWAGVESCKLLLKHGADIQARAPDGRTVLHAARTPAHVRLFVEHGADIDAVAEPRQRGETDLVYTPLQASLLRAYDGDVSVARAFLDLGADPHRRDLDGRSSLCYCTSVEALQLILPLGLDPHDRLPDGGTLLHNLFRMKGGIRAAFPGEVALLDLLLAQGIDINAVDDAGQTMLHAAAIYATAPEDIQLLLDRGADATARDKSGKRAVDLVSRSQKEIRSALK